MKSSISCFAINAYLLWHTVQVDTAVLEMLRDIMRHFIYTTTSYPHTPVASFHFSRPLVFRARVLASATTAYRRRMGLFFAPPRLPLTGLKRLFTRSILLTHPVVRARGEEEKRTAASSSAGP